MILVDSGVWIDFFNGIENRQTVFLEQVLGRQLVATGDLILMEVLQGFRRDEDFRLVLDLLRSLETFTLLNPDLAVQAASHYRALRRRGITMRRTVDTIIATFCIAHDMPLLFSDRDFLPFVQHLGLRSALPQSPS